MGMMRKKYLMVSLLAAAALLTGCSNNTPNPNPSTFSADRGLPHASATEQATVSAKTLEDGAMSVVQVPQAVTQRPDYVPVPFGNVSGSVAESNTDITVVFNTFQRQEAYQWVQALISKGWTESKSETVDTPTTYNVMLTNGNHEMIALYSNNTSTTKNTVISFSK